MRVVLGAVLMVGVGCSLESPGGSEDASWVGTITTEGAVTSVVTESGSVWGGTAMLVEEASIGVAAGEQSYMLADIASIVASQDRIFLLETNPPTVRVYDMDGKHLRDIGSEGQGPGEFVVSEWGRTGVFTVFLSVVGLM